MPAIDHALRLRCRCLFRMPHENPHRHHRGFDARRRHPTVRQLRPLPLPPAGTAGIYLGDVLVSAAGRKLDGVQVLQRLMLGSAIGARLPVTLLRRGAFVDVVAVPVELAS